MRPVLPALSKIALVAALAFPATAAQFRHGPVVGTAAIPNITVDSDWGASTCSSGSSCTATSPTRTLTVPGGSSGVLKFVITANAGNLKQYSKNAGAFTTFSTNTTVTFANGDTLAFKCTQLTPADVASYEVRDNVTNSLVGSVDLQNIFGL